MKPNDNKGKVMEIKGRDLINGVPKEMVLSEYDIAEALVEPVSQVVEAAKPLWNLLHLNCHLILLIKVLFLQVVVLYLKTFPMF